MSDNEDVYMCEDDEDYGLVSITNFIFKLFCKIFSLTYMYLYN